MTTFFDWFDQVTRDRQLDSDTAVSKVIGISPFVIGRWRDRPSGPGNKPSPENLRKIADGLGVSIQSAFVAAGYMHPSEAGTVQVVTATESLTDGQLINELARRLESSTPAATRLERSPRSEDAGLPVWRSGSPR